MRWTALFLLALAACMPPPEAEAPADDAIPSDLERALAAAEAQQDPDAVEADLDEINQAEAANEEAALSNPVGQRWFLTNSGGVRIEDDPYAPRPFRRADHDHNVTLLAPDVALVVQPAIGAPIAVSNMLGGALVRRFAGALRMKEAMAAAKVFVIQPRVAQPVGADLDALIVDWRLRTEKGKDVGLVYAARRPSGEPDKANPWAAFTPADAEHIALQTAGHLLEAPVIQAALLSASAVAALDRTPNPREKPKRTPRPKPRPES